MTEAGNRNPPWVYVALIALLVAGALSVLLVWKSGGVTSVEVVAEAALAREVRQAAVNAGAEKLRLASFRDGADYYEQADAAYGQSRLQEAMEGYKEAIRMFRIAKLIASAQIESLVTAERLQGKTVRLGVESDDSIRVRAERQLKDALNAVDNNDTSAALVSAKAAVSEFNDAIRLSPRSFTKGSTRQDIRFAIDLCKRYMGECDERWYDTEVTAKVSLKPFRIDAYEVKNSDFAGFVADTEYETIAEQTGYSYIWNGTKSVRVNNASWRTPDGSEAVWEQQPDYPVTHIAFDDAEAFCQWKGGRIPTEAEWEYAARGAMRYQFPWGNEWDDDKLLRSGDTGSADNKPVGSYQPGIDGAKGYDFAGSVWEWTWNETGNIPVLKGGSYLEKNPANFRAAAAKLNPAQVAHSDDGFRCVEEVAEWAGEFFGR